MGGLRRRLARAVHRHHHLPLTAGRDLRAPVRCLRDRARSCPCAASVGEHTLANMPTSGFVGKPSTVGRWSRSCWGRARWRCGSWPGGWVATSNASTRTSRFWPNSGWSSAMRPAASCALHAHPWQHSSHHDLLNFRRPMKPPPATSSRKATNVTIDAGLLEHAKSLGINVSKASEEGLSRAVAAEQEAIWLHANQAALESSSAYVDRSGIPLAQHRNF